MRFPILIPGWFRRAMGWPEASVVKTAGAVLVTTPATLIDNPDERAFVTLSWSPARPHEIEMHAAAASDPLGEVWVFARQLLHDVQHQAVVGGGDITLTVAAVDELHIALSSPEGACTLVLPAPLVAAFARSCKAEATPAVLAAAARVQRAELDRVLAELTA